MHRSTFLYFLIALPVVCFCCKPTFSAPPAPVPIASPEALGFDSARLALIDDLVNEGLSQSKMPGAVVVVGRRGGVAFRKAYGFPLEFPETASGSL